MGAAICTTSSYLGLRGSSPHYCAARDHCLLLGPTRGLQDDLAWLRCWLADLQHLSPLAWLDYLACSTGLNDLLLSPSTMDGDLSRLARHTASLHYSLLHSPPRMNNPLNDLANWHLLCGWWLLDDLGSLGLYSCLHPLLDHLPTLHHPLGNNLPLGVHYSLLHYLPSLVHNYLASLVHNLALGIDLNHLLALGVNLDYLLTLSVNLDHLLALRINKDLLAL